jgi:RNA polymerase subunit RPABC4/transcription elongation factor Spt4
LRYRRCGSCDRKVDADLMICPFCNGPVTPY